MNYYFYYPLLTILLSKIKFFTEKYSLCLAQLGNFAQAHKYICYGQLNKNHIKTCTKIKQKIIKISPNINKNFHQLNKKFHQINKDLHQLNKDFH